VVERVHEIYPPEAADWVRENNIPQPPTEYCDVHGPTPASGDVAITRPRPYDYIRRIVQIQGNARGPDVQLYRLQYGPGLNPPSWIQIGADHHHTVDNGLLEIWDVSQLDGLHTLQLSVVDWNNNYRQATIQVTIDNISPTVEITYPITGQLYVMEDDEWVSIQAQAMDNFSMKKVEFYLDDELLTYDTVSPYNQRWTIVMTTTLEEDRALREMLTEDSPITLTNSITVPHTIHVVAVDAAGNRMKSEEVVIYVVHKQEEEEEAQRGDWDLWIEGRWAFIRREDEIPIGA